MATIATTPTYLYAILGWATSATDEGCAPIAWGSAEQIAADLIRDENGPEISLAEATALVAASADRDEIEGRDGWSARIGRRLYPSPEQLAAAAAALIDSLPRWAASEPIADAEREAEARSDWEEAIREAADCLRRGNLRWAGRALEQASRFERDLGDDPATQQARRDCAAALGLAERDLIDELRRY